MFSSKFYFMFETSFCALLFGCLSEELRQRKFETFRGKTFATSTMAANAQDNVVKALSYVEKKVQNIGTLQWDDWKASLLWSRGSNFRFTSPHLCAELVQQAATSTGLRPAYVAVAGGLAALGFLFFGFGAGFVV